MMFTSLDYLTKAPAERINLQQFEQFKQQVIVDNAQAASAVSENHGWVIDQLPKGFMLIRSNMRYSQPMILNNVAESNAVENNAVENNANETYEGNAGKNALSTIPITATQSNPVSSSLQSMSQSIPLQSGQAQPDLLHLVYSDGLASVSVFIKKSFEAESHFEGVSSMGVINAFGNVIDDYFVTAVGVVPVNTVQIIAQSAVKSFELTD
jgi:negative regulator of sigma E activity